MNLMEFDEADLLSRVMQQTAERSAPPAARRPALPQRPATTSAGWGHAGILGPTRVETTFGHVPAHLVRVGDTLRTQDGGFERVQRISDIKIDEDFLARHPEAAPVILRRHALDGGVPHQDVSLSPAQKVALGPNRFETRLVPASELSRERGAVDKTLGMMVYVRFHLGRPARINCDGLWVAVEPE